MEMSHLPTYQASVCLHRQRQNLLVEFPNEFRVANMGGQDIGHVLAHRDAALRGFTLDDLVDDAIRPRHDLRTIALMCAAPLGHGANSASDAECYLITTRGLFEAAVKHEGGLGGGRGVCRRSSSTRVGVRPDRDGDAAGFGDPAVLELHKQIAVGLLRLSEVALSPRCIAEKRQPSAVRQECTIGA